MERGVRWGWVDLTNRTAEIKEVLTRTPGGWNLHFEELGFQWELDRGTVALSTGPLTGTGVPGSGAMVWSCLDGGRIHHDLAQGRFGAALRCAGVDLLSVTGRSAQPLRLRISQGRITLENPEGNAASLLAARGFEDAALLSVSREMVVEDRYFAVAGKEIAARLLDKGICAVIAEGDGAVPIADSEGLAALCVELWREVARSGRLPPGGRDRPARFLSIGEPVSLERPAAYDPEPAREALFGALGAAWEETMLAEERPKRRLAQLLEACLGQPCTEEELTAFSKRLRALNRKTWRGGTAG